MCARDFSLKADMEKHILSVHEKKKPFKCDTCDYCTSHRHALKRHIATVHKDPLL